MPNGQPHLGPCQLWTGALDETGHGVFADSGGVAVRAHRFAYELAHGEDAPAGTQPVHLCGVKHCVAKGHYVMVSRKAAMKAAFRKRPWNTTAKKFRQEQACTGT